MRWIVERDEAARIEREKRDRQRDLQFAKLIEVLSVAEGRRPQLEQPRGPSQRQVPTSAEESHESAGGMSEVLTSGGDERLTHEVLLLYPEDLKDSNEGLVLPVNGYARWKKIGKRSWRRSEKTVKA